MGLRLDGRVAVVTGAGGGLGKAHALLLAKLGAKVVVNDLGGSVDGRGGGARAADDVVDEIRSSGGQAVANYDSVSELAGAQAIVQKAVDAFGTIDILVNHAGILRDKSFAKMDMADFDAVVRVHLLGTAYCSRSAWEVMKAKNYGRIVVTTSIAGTNGNFGQANYCAAKMGVLGLMNGLAIEGAKNNILVNAISPAAMTRMSEGLGLVPDEISSKMRPELVSPAVAWLCSDRCPGSAMIVSAGAGGYALVKYFETEGVQFPPAQDVTVDMFDEAFSAISDMATATPTEMGPQGRMEARLRAGGYL